MPIKSSNLHSGTLAAHPLAILPAYPTFVTIDRVAKNAAGAGAWEDVDCSVEVPVGAFAVVGVLWAVANNVSGGVRKNGAADLGSYVVLMGVSGSGCQFYTVELDANRVFEQRVSDVIVDNCILGYYI